MWSNCEFVLGLNEEVDGGWAKIGALRIGKKV
jgi:hypothetical protein